MATGTKRVRAEKKINSFTIYFPHTCAVRYAAPVMTTASPLTSQIDEIKTTLASLLQADRKDEALELFVSILSQLATDHDKLAHQLRLMLKNRFGRKTERLDPAQLRLFLEESGGPSRSTSRHAPWWPTSAGSL